MSIKAVLFDLDGTLLPMDQDRFVMEYFRLLAKRLAPIGYDAEPLKKAFWGGVGAMVKNDGSCRNEEAFWKVFTQVFGKDSLKNQPFIEAFYSEEFQQVQKVCGYSEKAKQIVELVKKQGKLPILATNPLFPQVATDNRMGWAGLSPEMFAHYTTYEHCHYCKPNPKYYQEVLENIGCTPDECIMVGNDVDEDMIPAKALGMQVFLLKDCLINKEKRDLSEYPQGGFKELYAYLNERL